MDTVFLWGDENVLELAGTVAELCEYSKRVNVKSLL